LIFVLIFMVVPPCFAVLQVGGHRDQARRRGVARFHVANQATHAVRLATIAQILILDP